MDKLSNEQLSLLIDSNTKQLANNHFSGPSVGRTIKRINLDRWNKQLRSGE